MKATAILLLLAGALSGCMTDSPDEYTPNARDMPKPAKADWSVSEAFRCDDFPVLWEVAKSQASKNRFRVDDDATTYKDRRIVTAWVVEMGVMKNDGKRRRRFVEFDEQPGVKSMWKVRVATVRQRNVDIDDPLNPLNAEWKKDEPDMDDSDRVAFMIAAQFTTFGPSKEFEAK
jgi:hypothetical protein